MYEKWAVEMKLNWIDLRIILSGKWRCGSRYGKVVFLSSIFRGGEWSASRCKCGNAPGTHWLAGWMVLIAGLEAVIKMCFELSLAVTIYLVVCGNVINCNVLEV